MCLSNPLILSQRSISLYLTDLIKSSLPVIRSREDVSLYIHYGSSIQIKSCELVDTNGSSFPSINRATLSSYPRRSK